jgi:D-glycero-D-manno-heptose 1,7-bisphosphate phosphatase
MVKKPFILVDRDGTINAERNYLSDPEQLELLPGAAEGLRALAGLGFGIVIVTNQSGIARGYFSLERLAEIHRRLLDMLAKEGVPVAGIYVCPHGPDSACDCRKPLPGLALRAAAEQGIDLARSFVIGDKAADVELGHAVGAVSILVLTGYGREHEAKCRPDHVCDDLAQAARRIAGLIALQNPAAGGN